MTAISEFRNRLERAGVTLRLRDGVLRAGPSACVTEALRAFIADNKPALVEGLELRDAFVAEMAEAFPGSTVEGA